MLKILEEITKRSFLTMPFLKKITPFCHKSHINRSTEIVRLFHKDSSCQGAHITCQKNGQKIWYDVDNQEANAKISKIYGIFSKYASQYLKLNFF
jgi:hypothetical protein